MIGKAKYHRILVDSHQHRLHTVDSRAVESQAVDTRRRLVVDSHRPTVEDNRRTFLIVMVDRLVENRPVDNRLVDSRPVDNLVVDNRLDSLCSGL